MHHFIYCLLLEYYSTGSVFFLLILQMITIYLTNKNIFLINPEFLKKYNTKINNKTFYFTIETIFKIPYFVMVIILYYINF